MNSRNWAIRNRRDDRESWDDGGKRRWLNKRWMRIEMRGRMIVLKGRKR